MVVQRFLNTWLPPPVRDSILNDEPGRFAAAVEGLATEIAAADASSEPNRWSKTLRWIPVLKAFLGSKVDYTAPQVTLQKPRRRWTGTQYSDVMNMLLHRTSWVTSPPLCRCVGCLSP